MRNMSTFAETSVVRNGRDFATPLYRIQEPSFVLVRSNFRFQLDDLRSSSRTGICHVSSNTLS